MTACGSIHIPFGNGGYETCFVGARSDSLRGVVVGCDFATHVDDFDDGRLRSLCLLLLGDASLFRFVNPVSEMDRTEKDGDDSAVFEKRHAS